MSLTLPGTGGVTLPAGSSASSSPATGDRSTLLATMAKFADEFGSQKSSSGYQKLPSGLIIQWGSTTTSSGMTAGTFPIAFQNAIFQFYCTLKATISPTPFTTGGYATSLTTFGVVAGNSTNGVAQSGVEVVWLAIGY